MFSSHLRTRIPEVSFALSAASLAESLSRSSSSRAITDAKGPTYLIRKSGAVRGGTKTRSVFAGGIACERLFGS